MIHNIANQIKSALLLLHDPKRKAMAMGYYPTKLEVIGVTVPNVKAVLKETRKAYPKFTSQEWIQLALALTECEVFECSQIAIELFNNNKKLTSQLSKEIVIKLDQNLDNWVLVDTYSTYLLGVAWREKLIDDNYIQSLIQSQNVWDRRKAIAATIALNQKSRGGKGDTKKTIAVCEKLVSDHEDMIVKALSWALRVLISIDREAVILFLDKHETLLHKRIIREVNTKLYTGLKNPKF